MSLIEQPLINFTKNAANKVFELISDEKQTDLNLRVAIAGGGCSGFQYNFLFDEHINSDDHIVESEACYQDKKALIKLLVDPISLQYLEGAEVDYQHDLQGEQFVVRNPNANSTCGCGNSFDM